MTEVRTAPGATVWIAHRLSPSDHLTGLLDPVESLRRRKFAETADRDRFTFGVALLRMLVSEITGVPARRVRFDRTCPDCGRPHGRPRVVDMPELVVSVAHSGDVVVVGASAVGSIGVDVEQIPLDWVDLADGSCTPTERAGIHDAAGFATNWVRKEAVLKAHGTGLRVDPRHVEMTTGAERPSLLRLGEAELPDWTLADLDVGPDHRGAVAVLHAPAPVAVRIEDARWRLRPHDDQHASRPHAVT